MHTVPFPLIRLRRRWANPGNGLRSPIFYNPSLQPLPITDNLEKYHKYKNYLNLYLQYFATPPFNHRPSLIMSETPSLHAQKLPHDSRLYSNFEISLQMEKTFNVFHITDIISHPVCSDFIFSHYKWWSHWHWICSMWSLFSLFHVKPFFFSSLPSLIPDVFHSNTSFKSHLSAPPDGFIAKLYSNLILILPRWF